MTGVDLSKCSLCFVSAYCLQGNIEVGLSFCRSGHFCMNSNGSGGGSDTVFCTEIIFSHENPEKESKTSFTNDDFLLC